MLPSVDKARTLSNPPLRSVCREATGIPVAKYLDLFFEAVLLADNPPKPLRCRVRELAGVSVEKLGRYHGGNGAWGKSKKETL